MSTRQYFSFAVVIAVFSLLGGMASSWILLPKEAAAKGDAQLHKVRTATRVVIVDDRGNKCAVLDRNGLAFLDNNGETCTVFCRDGMGFFDEDGVLRAAINMKGLSFMDDNEDVIFHAPMDNPREKAGRSRSDKDTCIESMVRIDHVKQEWALEEKKTGSDTPTKADLLPYLKKWPKCPAGGTYKINCVNEDPTCSVSGHEL